MSLGVKKSAPHLELVQNTTSICGVTPQVVKAFSICGYENSEDASYPG